MPSRSSKTAVSSRSTKKSSSRKKISADVLVDHQAVEPGTIEIKVRRSPWDQIVAGISALKSGKWYLIPVPADFTPEMFRRKVREVVYDRLVFRIRPKPQHRYRVVLSRDDKSVLVYVLDKEESKVARSKR